MEKSPLESFAASPEFQTQHSPRARMNEAQAKEYVGERLHDALKNLLDSHQLILPLAKGGNQLVFALHEQKRHTGEVRERQIVAKLQARLMENEMTKYVLGTQTREDIIKELEEYQKRAKQHDTDLREMFGTGAVLPSRSLIMDVPVSEELYIEMSRGDREKREKKRNMIASALAEGRPFPSSFPALIEIQPRHDEKEELLDREIPLTSHYMGEHFPGLSDPTSKDRVAEYQRALKLLTEKSEDVYPLPGDLESVLTVYPDLERLQIEASVNKKVKTKLGEFAKQCIRFVNEKGMVLDLAGHRNTFLEKTPSSVRVRMMDPLYGDEESLFAFTDTVGALRSFSVKGATERKEISTGAVYNAYNVLHMVCMINAYAMIAEIPERLEIPGLSDVDPKIWLQHFEREIFLPSRLSRVVAEKSSENKQKAALIEGEKTS